MSQNHIIRSFVEYASAVETAPFLMELCDVLQKADTPCKRCITDSDVDKGPDALKDSIHSRITHSTGYANEMQRESEKNTISLLVEFTKAGIKDFLRTRGLLVMNKVQ